MKARRAVVLIDGEHYPEVVAAALEELSGRYEFAGAVFLGGTEKIKSDDLETEAEKIFGLPVTMADDPAEALVRAIGDYSPEVIVDASDEPVLGYRDRFRLIGHALAAKVPYEGADFAFSPPLLEDVATTPSLSIIGTAKRVGKTAVSGFVARTLKREWEGDGDSVVIVPMGRGGPPDPEVIEGFGEGLTVADLLEWSRQGRHAASDHVEDAVLSRVTTVGCRRCGGGMAGQPLVSNVAEGARIANDLEPRLTIYEGSGAAMSPIRTDARLLVAGAHQPPAYVEDYLGVYRVLISDAVVLAMAEEPMASSADVERVISAIRSTKGDMPIIPVVFRPTPVESVEGASVAVFTTAPAALERAIRRHLEDQYGCEVRAYSGSLSNRKRLREDLRALEGESIDAYLTEIKAAAIDVVAEEADRRDTRLVFLDNTPVETGSAGAGDLEELSLRLARLAEERFEGRR